MKELRFLIITFFVITAISVLGVSLYMKGDSGETKKELSVVSSFYPMYVTSSCLLDGVEGVTLSNLSDPHTGCLHDYVLTTKDMKLLSEADAFVVNGGGIESFLGDIESEYPDLIIVDSSSNITTKDTDGIYSDEDEPNVHYWMSVELYKKQVEAVSEGLCGLLDEDPASVLQIKNNTKDYLNRLSELQEEQDKIKDRLSGCKVVLFHGAYAYVAKDFDMNVSFVMDLDEEEQTSAGEVSEMMDAIGSGDIPLVLAEENYGKKMGDLVLQNTSARVIYLDTLTRNIEGSKGDIRSEYIDRMKKNIDLLKEFINENDYS